MPNHRVRDRRVATRYGAALEHAQMKPPAAALIRLARGKLTQAQAAALIGGARRTWQAWELGQNPMSPHMLRYFRIAKRKSKEKHNGSGD
jgi:DNA-binding transcriptional regulator YiaG